MQRVGVFVCWCGSNIAGTVDVQAVSEALKNEPGVVFSTNYQYMCSQAGQDMIKNAVKEHNLTGIVVCSCSPRMHEATFRKTAAAAGLNPYMVEIANIREQCSWVHKDVATGTDKAIILARAAVAKVNLNAPLTPGESPVTKRALVIGGGGGFFGFGKEDDLVIPWHCIECIGEDTILVKLTQQELSSCACSCAGKRNHRKFHF